MPENIALVIRTKRVELLAMAGKRVLAKASSPLEGGDPQQLVLAIRTVLGASGQKAQKVVVAIEHPDVLFRFFTLPALPKAEWDGAVQFESRRYIPFKPDALAWDYCALQSKGSSGVDVVFGAMPKAVLDGLREAFASVGVQASCIEPRAMSLARLSDVSKPGAANEFVCLVDIEQDIAHLAIAKRSLPYLTRDINFSRDLEESGSAAAPGDPGSMALVDPAGSAAGAQAGGASDTPGTGQPIGADAADPRVQRLLSELSVSMDFFMREYPSTTIAKVVLFGDQALVATWSDWLASRLVCPVERGDALLAKRIQGEAELSWASAVGALQPRGSETIDFLRRRSGGKIRGEARSALAINFNSFNMNELIPILRGSQTIISLIVAAGALLVLWFGGQTMVSGARFKLQHAVESRPDVGWGLNQLTVDQLTPIKQKAESQLAFFKRLDQRPSLAGKLDALARILPDGIWLTSLSYDGSFNNTGAIAPKLVMSGACYQADGQHELLTIQRLEQTFKENPVLFGGFNRMDLGQIGSLQSLGYSYRGFQMELTGDGKS